MTTPYHRLAHAHPWRAVGEIALALVLMFGGMIVLFGVGLAIAGADTIDELDELSEHVVTMAGLALFIPGALLAARIVKRAPGQLSSVAGRLRWRWLWRCGALILALELAMLAAGVAIWLITGDDGPPRTVTNPTSLPLWVMLVATVALVPFQAAGEEYFFRGTLMQGVGAWTKSPWLPIIITSAAFTALHIAPPAVSVALFLVAVIDGWLVVATGGLEAAIAAHVVNNLYAFAFSALIGESANDTESGYARIDWFDVIGHASVHLLYAALVVRSFRQRSAQGLSAVADQVEQHAAERRLGIEHPDHRADAEPLPPQQQ